MSTIPKPVYNASRRLISIIHHAYFHIQLEKSSLFVVVLSPLLLCRPMSSLAERIAI